MDRSKLCNIISITRLLPHFSNKNMNEIKSCIFSQLGCENESQFLCNVLVSIYERLSNASITIIKNKTFEIADKQPIKRQHMCTNKSNITVYKYIGKQYNDRLSKLHSDIIDYFGTFLTKDESIEFGYLNKQLYIETQKQSYLLKRCNDPIFTLNSHKMDKLFVSNSDAFNYTFPRHLRLGLKHHQNDNMVEKMAYFNNFFRRLSSLSTCVLACNCIPLELLLKKHSNYYMNNKSRDSIETFSIEDCLYDGILPQALCNIDLFCNKFDNVKHLLGIENMRIINKLKLRLALRCGSKQEYRKQMAVLTGKLLTKISAICQSIHFRDSDLLIESISQLTTIFHKQLKRIFLDSRSRIMIDNINITHDETDDERNTNYNVGMLENIEFESNSYVRRNGEMIPHMLDTLDTFDKFSMRRCVKQYTIHWHNYMHVGGTNPPMTLEIGDDLLFYDRIFFQDYDKHPLLEKIIIKLKDNYRLIELAKILSYFNQHYKQLFVERKFYFKHFKQIEIVFDGIDNNFNPSQIQRYVVNGNNIDNAHEFFKQNPSHHYQIDKKMIEIKIIEVEQENKYFGIIYQNIFDWLQRIQEKSSKDDQKAINGCKVVFVIA